MNGILEELNALVQKGTPCALVTVISCKGATPREPGAKMIVKSDGSISGTVGGAVMEFKAIKEALSALAEGKPRKVTYILHEGEAVEAGVKTGMLCGGEMELFIEPFLPQATLWLFGAGHVGKPTASLAGMCSFAVKVIDPRPDFNNEERFPNAQRRILQEFDIASAEVNPLLNDYAVIVTPCHDTDFLVLNNIINKSFKYIGMICSKRKWSIFRQRMIDNGVPAERIDQIHAPIGLDIGSETPEEIAVSIVAELIKVRKM
jgi:xanthine dehydrogenase accessory factor